MILTLVERYIFRKALLATAVAAGGLIGVLWIVRAVQTVDVIMSKGQGISTYLKMTSLGLPGLVAAVIPLALLIGLIRTINGLNEDSELVVLNAAGASRVSLLKPFLALSLLVSLLVYTLHLWAAPYSLRVLQSYINEMRADLISVLVQKGTFEKVGKGLTFHVAERAPGGLLKGVFILDTREKAETFTYLAQEGNVSKSQEQSFLVLQNGQIHKSSNLSGNLSIIRFSSYAFNLSNFSGDKQSGNWGKSAIPTTDLIYPDKSAGIFKRTPGKLVAELHKRLTGGLYPLMVGLLVLAYLGNPNSHRQGQKLVTITACCVILGLRAVTIYGEGAIKGNVNMVYLVWLVPLATIAFSIFILATDRSAFSQRTLALFERLGNGFSSAFSRILKRFRQIRYSRFTAS